MVQLFKLHVGSYMNIIYVFQNFNSEYTVLWIMKWITDVPWHVPWEYLICVWSVSDKLKAGGVGGLPKLKCLGTVSFPPYSCNSFPAQMHRTFSHGTWGQRCVRMEMLPSTTSNAQPINADGFQNRWHVWNFPLFAKWKRRVSPACGIHISDMSVMSVLLVFHVSSCIATLRRIRKD